METTASDVLGFSKLYVWIDGEPVAFVVAQDDGGTIVEKIYSVVTDHLMTPRQLVGANGQVAWTWNSAAFGDTPAESTFTMQEDFPLRFPGQYYDYESGLHYNWNRYFAPEIGRYVSSDPIGLSGGPNPYVYSASNSVRYKDQTGLDYWIDDAVPSEAGEGWHESFCVGEPDGERFCISFGRKPGQGECWFGCKGHV